MRFAIFGQRFGKTAMLAAQARAYEDGYADACYDLKREVAGMANDMLAARKENPYRIKADRGEPSTRLSWNQAIGADLLRAKVLGGLLQIDPHSAPIAPDDMPKLFNFRAQLRVMGHDTSRLRFGVAGGVPYALRPDGKRWAMTPRSSVGTD